MRAARLLVAVVAVVGCGGDDAATQIDAALPVDGALPVDAAAAIDAAGPDAAPGATVVRVHYPAGTHTVTLRGSGAPLSWTSGVALTAGADDTWTFTATGLAAPIEFKPLLDDATWARGPNYHLAPGQALDLYPHFTATAGRVVTLIPSFTSTALGNSRAIRAYLPAAYDENPRARFPVLYMHDGQNLFDPATAFGGNEWQVDEALDAAGEAGRCATGATCGNDGDCGGGACLTVRDTIVIGIDNTPGRIWELTPTADASIGDGGGGDAYLTMVATELKPTVDAMLRTSPGPADTAIMGSSLGGLISAYAGVTRPGVFGLIGAMSPSTWWDDRVIIARVAATPATPRPRRVYVDSGNAGASSDDVANTNQLAQTYLGLGYVEGTTFHHVVQAGATHSEVYWAQRFPAAALFLMGPRP
ncbi:MAG: alpha/beta hydrolase [Myxococcales bacterium]|nr:alpha/beta hydrolase [Myxococcales bacterium]